jgi:prepilin-type N-terminal cleavage/methylation domain-containing protein
MCRQRRRLASEVCEAGDERCHGARTDLQGGFTLLEIAIVLMVIAITAAFAIPQVVNYTRMYRLGVAARNVATALQRARYLATSNNTRGGIQIDNASQIDIIQYDPSGGSQNTNAGLVTLPPDITIAPTSPRQVAFDGRGAVTPIPVDNPVIEIDGAFGYYSTVTVSTTGQVTVSATMPKPRS